MAAAAVLATKRQSMKDTLARRMTALSDHDHHHKKDSFAPTKTDKDMNDVLAEEEKDPFKKFFESGKFDLIICPLIILCCLLIAVEIDNSGKENETAWLVVNSIWNVIWFFECGLKLYCLGKSYFQFGFNRFDFFLLWTSVIDTWILPFIPGSLGAFLAEWALTIRMLRILRLIRFVRMFPNLWHIVDGFIKALNPLGWTLCLMFIVNFASGVYLTLVVGHRCDFEYADWSNCDDFFGKVPRSMFSLVQVTTLDSWASGMARHIIAQKPFLFLFFMFYLMLCVFGLLNIIVGIIVESSIESKADVEREEIKKKLHNEREKILSIFASADNDGSGAIDYGEFQAGLADETMSNLFKDLGLDADHNARTIFDILDDDSSGVITIHQFIEGILKFQNHPSKLDMYSIARNVQEKAKMELVPEIEELIMSALGHETDESFSANLSIEQKREKYKDRISGGNKKNKQTKKTDEAPATVLPVSTEPQNGKSEAETTLAEPEASFSASATVDDDQNDGKEGTSSKPSKKPGTKAKAKSKSPTKSSEKRGSSAGKSSEEGKASPSDANAASQDSQQPAGTPEPVAQTDADAPPAEVKESL